MKLSGLGVVLLLSCVIAQAQLPPLRSTYYDGSASAGMQFAPGVYAPNLDMTLEAWVYRADASRCETIVAQDFTRSFWLGKQ